MDIQLNQRWDITTTTYFHPCLPSFSKPVCVLSRQLNGSCFKNKWARLFQHMSTSLMWAFPIVFFCYIIFLMGLIMLKVSVWFDLGARCLLSRDACSFPWCHCHNKISGHIWIKSEINSIPAVMYLVLAPKPFLLQCDCIMCILPLGEIGRPFLSLVWACGVKVNIIFNIWECKKE